MSSSIAMFLAATTCICAAGAADAAIQSVDWDASAHDQWLTRDTASGLDWLDLSLTMGQTMDQVRAGAWYANGFRYATSREVTDLFEHAGAVGLASPAGWLNGALESRGWASVSYGTQAGALIAALSKLPGAPNGYAELAGLTGSDAGGAAIPATGVLGQALTVRMISLTLVMSYSTYPAGNGSGAIPVFGSDTSLAEQALIELARARWAQQLALLPPGWVPVPGGTDSASVVLRNVPSDAYASSLGSYLVRDVTAVPEPATWALFAVGLLVVAPVLRRRQA